MFVFLMRCLVGTLPECVSRSNYSRYIHISSYICFVFCFFFVFFSDLKLFIHLIRVSVRPFDLESCV